MHPINKDLLTAIQLISMIWDSPIPSNVLDIVLFTNTRYSHVINSKGVFMVNKNIGKYDKKNRTLSQMVADLLVDNPDLRNFDFTNLRAYFKEEYPNESCFF